MRWVAGFFESHAPQSMCRAVALILAVAGVAVAWRNPMAWQTVGELVVSGAVALLTRTKPSGMAGKPSAPISP